MASDKIYCCQLPCESYGMPAEFVKRLFPEPTKDMAVHEDQRAILMMELELIGACEHYGNQAVIAHRESNDDDLMVADIKLAEYLGLSLREYEQIRTDPAT